VVRINRQLFPDFQGTVMTLFF